MCEEVRRVVELFYYWEEKEEVEFFFVSLCCLSLASFFFATSKRDKGIGTLSLLSRARPSLRFFLFLSSARARAQRRWRVKKWAGSPRPAPPRAPIGGNRCRRSSSTRSANPSLRSSRTTSPRCCGRPLQVGAGCSSWWCGERGARRKKEREREGTSIRRSSVLACLLLNSLVHQPPLPQNSTLSTTTTNRRGQPLRGPGGGLRLAGLGDPGRGRGSGLSAGRGGASSSGCRRRAKGFDCRKQRCFRCRCRRSEAPFRCALRDRRPGRRGP